MPVVLFFVLTSLCLAAAFAGSLRIRWFSQPQRFGWACVGIWALAALAVVFAGDRTLGAVPPALYLFGPGLVAACAWVAGAAR